MKKKLEHMQENVADIEKIAIGLRYQIKNLNDVRIDTELQRRLNEILDDLCDARSMLEWRISRAQMDEK